MIVTDTEIIKALECFALDKDFDDSQCIGCAFEHKFCTANMSVDIAKPALSLINRQKAEIERLQKHIQEGIDLAKQIPEMVATAQTEAIKEFEDKIKDKFDKHGVDYTAYVIVDDVSKELVGEDR